MRRLNTYSHIPFLRQRLMAYLLEDSVASRLKRTIPAEINYVFAGDTPDDVYSYEVSYQALFPVRALFAWIVKHGGLTVEDLADSSGQLFDDNKHLIPDSLIVSFRVIKFRVVAGLCFVQRLCWAT